MKKKLWKKNVEVFQGKKYLFKKKNYFEGWYFKQSTKKDVLAIIPGISITKKKKEAFIQIITKQASYYKSFPIEEFSYQEEPFFITIGENFFSFEKIHMDIDEEDLKVKGDIFYQKHQKIKTTLLSPNIMGPFSYLPFMECNHAIISMKCNTSGKLQINKRKMDFKKGNGYIEKDWGISFPKSYIWMEANSFQKKDASFLLSIAKVPLKFMEFEGIICVLKTKGKEYRLTTYNHAKICEKEEKDNQVKILLKQGKYTLEVLAIYNPGNKLIAPQKGNMKKDILESLESKISVCLKKKDKIIFKDTSKDGGLEIV